MIIDKKILDEVYKIACKDSTVTARKFLQEKTGLKETQARLWVQRVIASHDVQEQEVVEIKNKTKKNFFKSFGKSAQISSLDSEIKTLEQLLIACNVDLDKWVVDTWIANKWDGLQSELDSNGIRITKKVPLYQIKATLKRKKITISSERFAEEFKKAIHDTKIIHHNKANFFTTKKQKNLLLNLTIGSDLHFGRKTWGKETASGKDYDLDIASSLFTQSIDYILEQVPQDRIEKIILPIGGDFFNAEGLRETTTSGTNQIQDSRWQKIFLDGCHLITSNIEKLIKIAPIQVVPIIGNHDCESLQHLGFWLKAWFRSHSKFSIDDRNVERKYIKYGSNLIGFYHGHNIKHDQLPIIMATDCPEDWANAKSKIYITGHYHHQQLKDYRGVLVKVLSSLVPPDQWHDSRGFTGNLRFGEGILHHKEFGIIANYYFNADYEQSK